MSENIFALGPLGAGHAVKTLNNFVSSAGYVVRSMRSRSARGTV
jgi:hypothetical protein